MAHLDLKEYIEAIIMCKALGSVGWVSTATDVFGRLHVPQPGPCTKMTRLVTRIHCWACIARTLKHLWACIQRNAQIGHYCGARTARCNPRHVGVGGCMCGCGPETSRCFQTRRHKLPSPPFLTALSPLPHSHRRRRRW